MKNMKGVLVAVFVVVILVIVGAVSYEAMVGAPKAAEEQNILKQYNFPGNTNAGKTPSSGFPAKGSETVSQTADPELNTMLNDLDQTKDTTTTADIQDLQNDVSGLQ